MGRAHISPTPIGLVNAPSPREPIAVGSAMGRPERAGCEKGTGYFSMSHVSRDEQRKSGKSSLSPFQDAITVPVFEQGVPGVLHAFGTKSTTEFGATYMDRELTVVSVKQVHGTDVLVLPENMTSTEITEAAAGQGYDALVTTRPQTLLTVKTADCVPILLLDPARRVVAAVHAGWRGTVSRIAAKVVRVMHQQLGVHTSSLRAVIGPSIGRCCYEVDDPVLAPLKSAFAYWSEVTVETRGGRGQLDLRHLNQRQLEEEGLKPSHIAVVNLCTACHPELFYSYRRDGPGTRHMTSGIALL
jgi:YfiH family protein